MVRTLFGGATVNKISLFSGTHRPALGPCGTVALTVLAVLAAAVPAAAQEPAPAGLKVILLDPAVRFEDVASGARSDFGVTLPTASRPKKPAATAPGDEYQNALLSAARDEIGSRATLLDPQKLDPPIADLSQALAPLSSRLARGSLNDEALENLAHLAALDENYAILAQFCHVETGPGRSWDPNTGAIASSAASTLVQVALVSAKTGKAIWKGERLVRHKVLRPTDPAFGKILREMYANFDIH